MATVHIFYVLVMNPLQNRCYCPILQIQQLKCSKPEREELSLSRAVANILAFKLYYLSSGFLLNN